MRMKFSNRLLSRIMRGLMWPLFIFFSQASFAGVSDAEGQSILQKKISLQVENMKIKNVLKIIEQYAATRFGYQPQLVDSSRTVSLMVEDTPVISVLNMLFDSSVRFDEVGNMIIFKPTTSAEILATISGKVTDAETGEPLPGVNVLVKGTTHGASTDIDGKYVLETENSEAVLVFTFVGYLTQEIPLNSQSVIDVQLAPASKELQEVVVVGYGVQKKATLTGAVSAVKREDIITTKNENVQNMLTGKISGVRITQKTSEPGAFNNNFDIRGMGTPLVVIDGVQRDVQTLQRLDPNDIESISVLKDASAAIYGVRAANGVVLVTTQKGANNKMELNYSGSYTWQVPSGLPKTLDAIEYMTLRNERTLHNVNGAAPVFTERDFDDYRSGRKKSTDWYSLVFSKYAPQTMHNLSASGGNSKINYYFSLGYQYQEGFFKSGDLNYNKYNLRSNISAKITDRLTADLNISGIMDQQERPYTNASSGNDSWIMFRSFWRQNPLMPAYANDDPSKPFHGLIEGDNPVSFMSKDLTGHRKYNTKWIQTSAVLKYDVPHVKGLYLKTLLSYDYYVTNADIFQKQYNQYRYDEASKTYQTFSRQSPSSIYRDVFFKNQYLTQLSVNYENSFGKHNVGGLLIWEAQKREGDNFRSKRNLALSVPYLFAGLPYQQEGSMDGADDRIYVFTNMALAGRTNYSYANKYIVDFSFRRDGSSKFAKGKQWGFFPAAGVAWRISEESFFHQTPAFKFVDQLKLRVSYGVTGDDGASRYQFISGYNYPTRVNDSRYYVGGNIFDGTYNAGADHKGVPNENITWFTAKTLNAGLDFEGWNGLFGFMIEYFSRFREGLLSRRAGGIPTVVGAGLPEENLDSDRNYGFDLELTHRNRIKDFRYNVKGLLSMTRVKRLHVERAPSGSSWENWKQNENDRLQGVQRGLQGDGQFQSWEDIYRNPYYTGRGALPGDYRYQDWNGDGEINDNDAHPLGFDQYPWMNFGLSTSGSYKGLDVNLLMQGSALSTLRYGEQLREPLWGSGEASAMEQFADRWRPSDPNISPYDPSAVWVPGHFANTGSLPDENSSFNTVNSAYLRLKSLELGYTLPSKWIQKTGLKNLRIYANAYNLYTFTKVKFVDPEHPADTYGYLYPLNKTYSLGINVKF